MKTEKVRNEYLVGGWTNPFEKYLSNWIISPGDPRVSYEISPPGSRWFYKKISEDYKKKGDLGNVRYQ